MKFPYFFYFLVIFAFLDPDPADQNQYGSETLPLPTLTTKNTLKISSQLKKPNSFLSYQALHYVRYSIASGPFRPKYQYFV
jgi:hypothetical protein